MAPPVAAMTAIPVAAPLVAIPAVVEFTIVAVTVPLAGTIRPVRAVGVRAARAVPIRAFGTVWAMGIRSIWALGTVRSIPIGAVRTIGSVRPRLIGSIGTVRPIRALWPVRSVRAIGAIGAVPVGSLFRPLLRPLFWSALRSLRARAFLTRAVGVAVLALRLAAIRTTRTVLARLRPILGQNSHGGCGGHEEAGGRREHEKRAFHGRSPRTSELDGLRTEWAQGHELLLNVDRRAAS